MQKRKLTIAVTGLNAIDSPGPGVPVIRGLRESAAFETRIIGLAYENLEPGIYMHDLVHRTYMIPYPSEGTDKLMQRLEYIHRQENIDVIIPNFDAELYSFMRLEPALLTLNIHMFLPTFGQFEERHKVNLSAFGKKHDIHVPESISINSASELAQMEKKVGFPMVVKGKYYDAYIAQNVQQAESYFYKITAKWGYPVVIQKFVEGTEYNVIGLGDGKGGTLSAVAMRKQYITDKGKAWAGITITDDRLTELTERFNRGTQWRGAFELELMKSKEGTYYLMEVNPRIPAWVYLAIGVGHNIPEALVKLALGETVEPMPPYESGKLFIRYSWDMIVDREEFQHISLTGEL